MMEMSRAFLVTLSFRQDETYLLNSGLFKLPDVYKRQVPSRALTPSVGG